MMVRPTARSAVRYGQKLRRNIVLAVLVLLALLLVARLVFLHCIDRPFLLEQGNNRAMRIRTEVALRGMILDREGEPLAISSPVSTVVADPKVLWATLEGDFNREKEACLSNSRHSDFCTWINDKEIHEDIILMRYEKIRLEPLAAALEMPVGDMMRLLQERAEKRSYYLKRQLSPAQMETVMALKIHGILREDSYQRFYPAGELTGQIIGFTDIDEQGQEGIERQYNDWLSGQQGKVKVLQDRDRHAIEIVEETTPVAPGQNLQLSIDKRLQFIMRKTLSETMNQFQAKSVSAVMVDVASGEILAMVSLPDGNPNISVERVAELMKNKVITDVFEPGSTIKPISVAAALNAGVITTQTSFKTSSPYRIGKHTVRDTHNYPQLDTVGIIRKSSNVGMAMISQKTPREQYYQFMKQMGFGQLSGMQFPGEQRGILHRPEKQDDFTYATTFFGYGISTTALQIAHAYATIANGGVKMPLTLIKRQHSVEGEQIVSQQIANDVLFMMHEAVNAGGTGRRANTGSYTVAGKTGTAHKITDGRYDRSRYRGLFAGVAPAQNPKISLIVVVEEPTSGAYYGGLVAAPAFAKIVEWSLPILGVLPDKISRTDDIKLDIQPQFFAREEKNNENHP